MLSLDAFVADQRAMVAVALVLEADSQARLNSHDDVDVLQSRNELFLIFHVYFDLGHV